MFSKLLGYVVGGLLLAAAFIMFSASAMKIIMTLYKSMSLGKAVFTAICVTVALFIIFGVVSKD